MEAINHARRTLRCSQNTLMFLKKNIDQKTLALDTKNILKFAPPW